MEARKEKLNYYTSFYWIVKGYEGRQKQTFVRVVITADGTAKSATNIIRHHISRTPYIVSIFGANTASLHVSAASLPPQGVSAAGRAMQLVDRMSTKVTVQVDKLQTLL